MDSKLHITVMLSTGAVHAKGNKTSIFRFTAASLIIMATLWNRADDYIFLLWFLLSIFFFSSPILSRRRLDVYHTSTHGVALV